MFWTLLNIIELSQETVHLPAAGKHTPLQEFAFPLSAPRHWKAKEHTRTSFWADECYSWLQWTYCSTLTDALHILNVHLMSFLKIEPEESKNKSRSWNRNKRVLISRWGCKHKTLGNPRWIRLILSRSGIKQFWAPPRLGQKTTWKSKVLVAQVRASEVNIRSWKLHKLKDPIGPCCTAEMPEKEVRRNRKKKARGH